MKYLKCIFPSGIYNNEKYKLYPVVLFLFKILSCSLVDFLPDDQVTTNPSKENQILLENESVYVSFKFNPDKTSAESLFQVKDYKGVKSGTFSWKDRRMIFTPDEELLKGRRYTLDYSGFVLTEKGEKVKTEIVLHFFYITDLCKPPYLITLSPEAGSIVDRDEVFSFVFSKPMDIASVRKGFKINPETEYNSLWNESCTELTVSPDDRWKNLSSYVFSFSEDICCFEKIPAATEYHYTFYCRGSYVKPEITAVYNVIDNISLSWPRVSDNLNAVKCTDGIEIEFNLNMKKETVENSFSITPYISGRNFWKNERSLVFIPDKYWLWNKSYNIKISETAEGENDVKTGSPYLLSFKPDINELVLSSVGGKPHDGFPLYSFSENTFAYIDTGATAPYVYSFSFNFSQPFLTDTEKEKVQENINITAVFPPDASSPFPVLYSWISDNSLTVKYTGFSSYDSENNISYSYMLTLKGGESGIINNRGSFFSGDIKQMLRTK